MAYEVVDLEPSGSDYEVVILETAESEIESIVSYMANILKNPQAAANFMDELDRQFKLIKSKSDVFAVSALPELAAKNYHVSFVNNHIMLYAVRKERIYITHVFHQTQEYAKLV